MNRKSGAWPVFCAFLAMGFGDAVGPFVSLAKEQFQLSNFLAQLIPLCGFIMFGVLSVPMGVFQDKLGKKFVLILGLCIMLVGILIPAIAGLSTFKMFLITILLLGAGATTLQVAGNPMMRDVSAEGKYSRNLSLGQFVKAIGSLSGPLIPVIALRAFGANWTVIFPIYGAAVLITIVALIPLKTREETTERETRISLGSSLALLKNGYVAMMVLAIFLYVGAEVSVSTSIPLYLKERFAIDVTRMGLLGTGLFFLALTIGRFVGGVVLNWIAPERFLLITCALSILGLAGLFVPQSIVAILAVILIGLGFANIFPLVFSIAVENSPQNANALSGLMITAVAGGAVVPLLMGLLADQVHSVQLAFLVPLMAIGYVLWAAVINSGRRKQVAAAAASKI